MAPRHAAQRHHRHMGLPRQRREPHRPQRTRTGMGSGREQGRQEDKVCAVTLRPPQLGRVMHRRRPDHACRAAHLTGTVHAISAPAPRFRPGQHQDESAPTRDRPERLEQPPAFCRRRRMVPQDDAATPWQPFGRPHQVRRRDPLVAEQPERWQGARLALAARHGVPIAAPMTNDSQAVEEARARLTDISARIDRAARVAGRAGADVTLVAVSKTHDAAAIEPLILAGHRCFGENRVQEAQAKWPGLKALYPGLSLHMVGQLQSNKADEAVALFDAIHAVDRPSLVTALARAMDRAGRRPDCFIQVNIGDERQKGGCAVADLPALLAEARSAALPVVGLMAVPPADVEAAPYFALLGKLARDNGLAQLSMGMSGDFETAVMLGATHVRVGTALFGDRAAL